MDEIYEMIKNSIKEIEEEQKKVEIIANENKEIENKMKKLEAERAEIDDKDSNMYKSRTKKLEKLGDENRSKVGEMLEQENVVKSLVEEKKAEILQRIAEQRRYVDANLETSIEGIDLKALQQEKLNLEEQIRLNNTSREEFDKLSDGEKQAVRKAKEKYLLNSRRLKEINPSVELLETLEGKSQEDKYMELQSLERQVKSNFDFENMDKLTEMVEKASKVEVKEEGEPKENPEIVEPVVKSENVAHRYEIIEDDEDEIDKRFDEIAERKAKIYGHNKIAKAEEPIEMDLDDDKDLDEIDVIGEAEAEAEEEPEEIIENEDITPINLEEFVRGILSLESQINMYEDMMNSGFLNSESMKQKVQDGKVELEKAKNELKLYEEELNKQEKAGRDVSAEKAELGKGKAKILAREQERKMAKEAAAQRQAVVRAAAQRQTPVQETAQRQAPVQETAQRQATEQGKFEKLFDEGRDNFLMQEALFELGYSSIDELDSFEALNIRSAYKALKKDLAGKKLTIEECRNILKDTELEKIEERSIKDKFDNFAEAGDIDYMDSAMNLTKGRGIESLTDEEYEKVWSSYRDEYVNMLEDKKTTQITRKNLQEIVEQSIKATREERKSAAKKRMHTYSISHGGQRPKGLIKFLIKHDRIAKMLSRQDVNEKLIDQDIRIKARQKTKEKSMSERVASGISQEQQAENAKIFTSKTNEQNNQTISNEKVR